MPPYDRSGRRDPSFEPPEGARAQGPRFTMDDDLRGERSEKPRQGRDDFRADPRDEAVWRSRGRDYDELYEEPPSRPPYLIISTIAAVCAVAGAAWFIYNRGLDRAPAGPPPLIHADSSPVKIAPEEPGGRVVPNQDKLVYDRLSGARSPDGNSNNAEELLPKPEEPSRIPGPPPGAPDSAVQPPPVTPGGATQAELMAKARQQNSGSVEINGEREAKALANVNETPLASVASKKAGMMEAPKDAVAVKPTGETAAILGVPEGKDAVAAPAPTAPPPSHPSHPAARQQAAPPPAKNVSPEIAALLTPGGAKSAAPAASSGTMIQVGALRDEGEANREWSRLTKKYPDLFAGLKQVIVQAEVNGRTLYRLRAAGLSDGERAREICGKLKARGEVCLVP